MCFACCNVLGVLDVFVECDGIEGPSRGGIGVCVSGGLILPCNDVELGLCVLFLARLWNVVSMVLIVVGETTVRGLVVVEVRELVSEGTKADRAMREYVSFGDDVEEALATEAILFLLEAEVLLLLFLVLDLLRAFGQELESERSER